MIFIFNANQLSFCNQYRVTWGSEWVHQHAVSKPLKKKQKSHFLCGGFAVKNIICKVSGIKNEIPVVTFLVFSLSSHSAFTYKNTVKWELPLS